MARTNTVDRFDMSAQKADVRPSKQVAMQMEYLGKHGEELRAEIATLEQALRAVLRNADTAPYQGAVGSISETPSCPLASQLNEFDGVITDAIVLLRALRERLEV